MHLESPSSSLKSTGGSRPQPQAPPATPPSPPTPAPELPDALPGWSPSLMPQLQALAARLTNTAQRAQQVRVDALPQRSLRRSAIDDSAASTTE